MSNTDGECSRWPLTLFKPNQRVSDARRVKHSGVECNDSRHAMFSIQCMCQWCRNEFESGAICTGRRAGKIFSCPCTFFGFTNTIGRFGQRFRDGQYSLASFFFFVCCTYTHGAPVPSHL